MDREVVARRHLARQRIPAQAGRPVDRAQARVEEASAALRLMHCGNAEIAECVDNSRTVRFVLRTTMGIVGLSNLSASGCRVRGDNLDARFEQVEARAVVVFWPAESLNVVQIHARLRGRKRPQCHVPRCRTSESPGANKKARIIAASSLASNVQPAGATATAAAQLSTSRACVCVR